MPLYNSDRKYAKKWGVFKKPYKPNYNQDLYDYIPNNILIHLKYVRNQDAKYSIFNKPNLSTFLSIIWLSQQPQYRRVYYTWCCFLTRFNTVYYKPYVEYLMQYLPQTKLSILNQQIPVFKSLESYYYTVPHFQTFKSDYFFYDHYDYPHLLPYTDYIFKSDFTVYGVLWVGVERLRQKKYNEYVKAHYILHQSRYTPLRARYIIKNVLYPRKKLLDMGVNHHNWQLKFWYQFFLCAKRKKYQIILNNLQYTANTHTAPAVYVLNNEFLCSYYQNTRNYLNNYIWNLVDDYQKLNTPWFKGLLYVPIVWNLNKAFVDYLYQFPSQNRLDVLYASSYIIANGLSPEVYDRFINHQMVTVQYQAMGEFVMEDAIQDYFITHNLVKCMSKNTFVNQSLNKLNDYLFDNSTVNLLITNDIFNHYLVTRMFSNQARVSPLKIRSQTHLIDNLQLFEHIRDYILCGNFYKIPQYMSKVLGIMSYFYWRSYNTDAIHQAHKGRLHLHHYMQKLNIQLLLSQQLYNVYKLILYMWNVYQIGASTVGMSQTWNYMAVNYINWLHEYSYLGFFCLFKSSKIDITSHYYQQLYMNKCYTSLVSHIAVRRYLNNYLTVFKRFRRAPFDQARGTCIHGKNPDRLQQWLVHVNWMRIIGLKRSELPFYLYPKSEKQAEDRAKWKWEDWNRLDQQIELDQKIRLDQKDKKIRLDQQDETDLFNPESGDYLQELVKKTSHHHVNIYTCDLFVINKQNKFVNNIQFKPYIKITNMLYDFDH